jgi:hypothetical protein
LAENGETWIVRTPPWDDVVCEGHGLGGSLLLSRGLAVFFSGTAFTSYASSFSFSFRLALGKRPEFVFPQVSDDICFPAIGHVQLFIDNHLNEACLVSELL